MRYAILAYHAGGLVESWTPEQDVALMTDLLAVHDGLIEAGSMGPAARLAGTDGAVTLRGPGAGIVTDGPFAETKEHLLGFYVVDCETQDEAIAIARDLRGANPSAVYEIRPVKLYIPGVDLPRG